MGNIVIVKLNRPLEAVQFKDTEQGPTGEQGPEGEPGRDPINGAVKGLIAALPDFDPDYAHDYELREQVQLITNILKVMGGGK